MTEILMHDPTWSGHGGWWFFAPFLWILFFILIVGTLRAIFWRRGRRHWHHYHQNSARSILADRYAKGEIDEQEYRQRLAVLDSPPK